MKTIENNNNNNINDDDDDEGDDEDDDDDEDDNDGDDDEDDDNDEDDGYYYYYCYYLRSEASYLIMRRCYPHASPSTSASPALPQLVMIIIMLMKYIYEHKLTKYYSQICLENVTLLTKGFVS